MEEIDYKKTIHEMLGKIHGEEVLKRIYKFVSYIYIFKNE